jgi:hypothetical protein
MNNVHENEIEIEKCPNCGGELKSGKVLCPRTLSWQGQASEEIVPPFHWGIAKLQGWRCEKCRLVIFLYEKKERPALFDGGEKL